jgi:hypothetical protein
MFKGINAIQFGKRFQCKDDCYEYLVGLKWGDGYQCVKCGCEEYGKGRTAHHRRCRQCAYDESPTANTVFHDMRLSILKAFYMAFRIVTKKKGMSTIELASEVGVQQKTAWLFKRKIQAAIQGSLKKKLSGTVVSDETLVGGGKEGSYGRTHKEKEILFVAVEKLSDDRTGNIALHQMENFKLEDIQVAVEQNINQQATLYMDNYPTNRGIKKRRERTEIIMAKGSDFFEEIHKQIMMFKMWLTGIHHKCSKHHLKAYAAEYEYRFNRRNQREWIFHNILEAVRSQPPYPYSALKANCA